MNSSPPGTRNQSHSSGPRRWIPSSRSSHAADKLWNRLSLAALCRVPGKGRNDWSSSLLETTLALSGAAAAHDGPHVHDLVALGDVVTVEGVGALVQVGAVNLPPVAQLRLLVAVFPPQRAVFRPLLPHRQPRSPLHLVRRFGQRLVAVIRGHDVRPV